MREFSMNKFLCSLINEQSRIQNLFSQPEHCSSLVLLWLCFSPSSVQNRNPNRSHWRLDDRERIYTERRHGSKSELNKPIVCSSFNSREGVFSSVNF